MPTLVQRFGDRLASPRAQQMGLHQEGSAALYQHSRPHDRASDLVSRLPQRSLVDVPCGQGFAHLRKIFIQYRFFVLSHDGSAAASEGAVGMSRLVLERCFEASFSNRPARSEYKRLPP